MHPNHAAESKAPGLVRSGRTLRACGSSIGACISPEHSMQDMRAQGRHRTHGIRPQRTKRAALHSVASRPADGVVPGLTRALWTS